MKIVVCASGEGEGARVADCISKSPYLVVVDMESGGVETVSNPAMEGGGHRGVTAAMAVAGVPAAAVIGGHFGRKAFRVLSKRGVVVHRAREGTVRDVIQAYRDSRLPVLHEENPCHDEEEHRVCHRQLAGLPDLDLYWPR